MATATIPHTTLEPQVRFKRIAVLTDFSRNAAAALRYAAEMARVYKAEIILAHAYTPLPCAFFAPEANLVFEALRLERQELEARLRAETSADYLHGICCSEFIADGPPQHLLEELKNVDLLVVGTSGATGLNKAALGSTAETLLRSSSVPVLTVGPHCRPVAEGDPLRTVLYATDFSAEAGLALPYAVSIAQQHGAQLTMVHAAQGNSQFSPDEWMTSQGPADALRSILRIAPNFLFQLTCHVSCGAADSVILETARNVHAGIIVMGAHKRSRLPSLMSHVGGSTVYAVATNAECPVLMVRSGDSMNQDVIACRGPACRLRPR